MIQEYISLSLKRAKYSASQPEYSVISESDWTKVEVRNKEKRDNHDNSDGAVERLKKAKSCQNPMELFH